MRVGNTQLVSARRHTANVCTTGGRERVQTENKKVNLLGGARLVTAADQDGVFAQLHFRKHVCACVRMCVCASSARTNVCARTREHTCVHACPHMCTPWCPAGGCSCRSCLRSRQGRRSGAKGAESGSAPGASSLQHHSAT